MLPPLQADAHRAGHKKKRTHLPGTSSFIQIFFWLVVSHLVLHGKQFLQLVLECLAHDSIAHRLVAFDAVLQHLDFIHVLSHNCFVLCSPPFGVAVLHLYCFYL